MNPYTQAPFNFLFYCLQERCSKYYTLIRRKIPARRHSIFTHILSSWVKYHGILLLRALFYKFTQKNQLYPTGPVQSIKDIFLFAPGTLRVISILSPKARKARHSHYGQLRKDPNQGLYAVHTLYYSSRDQDHQFHRQISEMHMSYQGLLKISLNFPSVAIKITTKRPFHLPAATPELVHTFPSTVHLAEGTHVTFVPKVVTQDQAPLFVVALLPSRTPAFAKLAAPVHTLSR